MGETKKGTSFFQSVKSEFRKIIWPNKERLTKEASVVVVVSIILGILIAILLIALINYKKILTLVQRIIGNES